MIEYNDEHFMRQALREAQDAYFEGEIPIGAVLVINNKIVGRDHNRVEKLNDPTAHAEILVITAACSHLQSKYLPDATLYVTVEPCHMCAGASYWAKIKRVVYGATDDKQGFHHFCDKHPFHPRAEVVKGVLAEECAKLMKDFFKERR